jgi:predicted TIM-barrel fold metal-dependent hydrolase
MIDNKYYCIDAHCHVFPEKVAEKATEAIGDFYHIPMYWLGNVETLIKEGETHGMDHFLIHSVATKPEHVGAANKYLASVVASHPGKMTALGAVHPLSEDMEKDIDDLVSLGMHGIKIHPDIQGFPVDCDGYMKAFEICERKGLPALVHTGDYRGDLSNPNRVVNVLETFPDLTFVGAHFGGWSVWEDSKRLLTKYDNMYVDTSSTLFWAGAFGMRDCIDAYGIDRCMFGTDFPVNPASVEIKALLYLNYTEEDYRKLFADNARKIYRIDV